MGTSTGRADLTACPIFSPGYVCWFTGDRSNHWLLKLASGDAECHLFAGKDPERVRVRDTCTAQVVGPVS